MKTITLKHWLFSAIVAGLAFSVVAEESADEKAETPTPIPEGSPASAYLEFTDHLDGRCHILSEGGKLTTVENKHPDKNIRYRFTRVFAGVPQAGMARGVLEPSAKPVKLGCNQVDGHPQVWEIKVAEFVE